MEFSTIYVLLIGAGLGLLIRYLSTTLFKPVGQPAFPRKKESHPAKSHPPLRESNVVEVIVVGAGAAGLATAAHLHTSKVSYILVEKSSHIGDGWRYRYDRLHLHTIKETSSLPFAPLPSCLPTYVSKDELADYHEGYARMLGLRVMTGTCVKEAIFQENNSSGVWKLTCAQNDSSSSVTLFAKILVICTGQESVPCLPKFKGQDRFKGRIFHTEQYKNGKDFKEKKVLVVGYGNSGAEIALDLWEHGARPTCLIRSPLKLAPRWFTRIVYMVVYALESVGLWLPKVVRDVSTNIVSKRSYGDLEKFGIRLRDAAETTLRSPVQDLGTIELIRSGEIDVITEDIACFTKEGVETTSGSEHAFDAVILATGYVQNRPAYAEFLSESLCDAMAKKDGIAKSGVEVEYQKQLYIVGIEDFIGRLYAADAEGKQVVNDIRMKYIKSQ